MRTRKNTSRNSRPRKPGGTNDSSLAVPQSNRVCEKGQCRNTQGDISVFAQLRIRACFLPRHTGIPVCRILWHSIRSPISRPLRRLASYPILGRPKSLFRWRSRQGCSVPAAVTSQASSIRIVRRHSLRQQPCLTIPAVRPSLLDVYLRGDAWIDRHDQHLLTLYVGGQRLACFPASPFDGFALNQLLFTLRQRNPRRKVQGACVAATR
jgi:hypothetical protein